MPMIRHNRGLPIELINHVDLADMPDILGIESSHDARYYTEAELGSTVAPSGASLIGVEDAGGFFAGADVEAVLQEIMAVILPGAYLRLDGTNVPTANYNWVTNLTTTGTLQGGTITDGAVSFTGGVGTGLISLTDGVASWAGNSLTGFVNITATGTITGNTFTDGIATLTGGAWTGATYNGLTMGCAANVISITCGTTDLTVSTDCTINQDLSSTSSPTFNALNVTSLNGLTGIGCVANVISITCGTTDLTVSADCAINQNLNTAASPAFAGLTIGVTLVLASGSITDTTGAISFGNETLTTTTTVTAGTLTIGGGSITDTTGAISFGNENLTTTGTGTFQYITITAPSTNNYTFTTRGTDVLVLQSQNAGSYCVLDLFTQTGNSTENCYFQMFTLGTPANIANREFLNIDFLGSTNTCHISTQAGGIGAVYPMIIYTGANTNQLYLNTNHDVGINTVPDATFEVATTSSEGHQAITIDQNDADQAFIDFQGSASSGVTTNISTCIGAGAVNGPKYASGAGQSGWSFCYGSMVRMEVNGCTYWFPAYKSYTNP